eukprot:COSAG02_NODE_3276_length_7029_cov_3.468687_2_plen_86_part_00
MINANVFIIVTLNFCPTAAYHRTEHYQNRHTAALASQLFIGSHDHVGLLLFQPLLLVAVPARTVARSSVVAPPFSCSQATARRAV